MNAVAAARLLMDYRRQVKPEIKSAPWILRVTDHADKPAPVLVVKERLLEEKNGDDAREAESYLQERGLIYGESLRTIIPVLRTIVSAVCNRAGIPLGLEQFFSRGKIEFRGNLPLDEQAGCKLALIFRLQQRVPQSERVELIARRVERFSGEEAAYWHSRTTNFGTAANRWGVAGARLMLGGQPGDPAVQEMLDRLRSKF